MSYFRSSFQNLSVKSLVCYSFLLIASQVHAGQPERGLRERRQILARNAQLTSGRTSLILSKRDKAPVPTQDQCDAQMHDPGQNCIFYTAGTHEAALDYQEMHEDDEDGGVAIMGDEAMDPDGWVAETPAPGTPLYLGTIGAASPEDRWTDEDVQNFWNCMSAAMAKACRGTAYVTLGSDYSIPGNSVFWNYELPPIQDGMATGQYTELVAIPMPQGNLNVDDGSSDPRPLVTPTGPLETLLPCNPGSPPLQPGR